MEGHLGVAEEAVQLGFDEPHEAVLVADRVLAERVLGLQEGEALDDLVGASELHAFFVGVQRLLRLLQAVGADSDEVLVSQG